MGSFEIIKPPLSTFLSSSAIDKYQCWGQESNPGPLCEKRERYPLWYAAPHKHNNLSGNYILMEVSVKLDIVEIPVGVCCQSSIEITDSRLFSYASACFEPQNSWLCDRKLKPRLAGLKQGSARLKSSCSHCKPWDSILSQSGSVSVV